MGEADEAKQGAQLAPRRGSQPHNKGIKAADRPLDRTEAQCSIKIASIVPAAKQAARMGAGARG